MGRPTAAGESPVGERRLLSVSNYLMSIGAGDSSISFSDECHEELTSFKTRIEAFKSMHDNNQNSNEKQVIEKLKFCKVDQDGQVKLE